MRVEPVAVGGFLHCIKRGGRGLPIVRDDHDRWRFLRSLYYLNDVFLDENWSRVAFNKQIYSSPTAVYGSRTAVDEEKLFFRPQEWPKQKPITAVLGFTLLENHLHLLLMEIKEGGIAAFMQKFGQSMTNHFNEKYQTKGSIFQGGYKGKRISEDRHLMWVMPYVMVKNTFEMHPKGYKWAVEHFEEAWQWAIQYPFSSLGDYGGSRNSPIVDTKSFKDIVGGPKEFKRLCKDMIEGREGIKAEILDEIADLSFE